MTSEITMAPLTQKNKDLCPHNITEALNKLLELKRRGELQLPATVWCEGGTYPVEKPILITPEYSMPVTFKAVKGEKPVFDGGLHLENWEKTKLNGKTVLCTTVPEKVVHEGAILQFHVNGKRKAPASWPKHPEVLTPEKPEKESDSIFCPTNGFYVKKGDFNTAWYNPKGIEVLLYQLWTESHMPIESFDEKTGHLTFQRKIRFKVDLKSTRYVYHNVREALTEPGEFYFDNTDNKIYYLPEKGENEKNIDAVIPQTGVMMMLAGDIEKNEYVQWLGFEGLTFRYAGAGFPKGRPHYEVPASPGLPECRNFFSRKDFVDMASYGGYAQASAHLPGIIMLKGCRDIAIEKCTVEHCNWYAIAISEGSSEIRISHNKLRDLGGGGVTLSGAAALLREIDQEVHHISITDNHIHDCGSYYLSAVGILMGHARNCLIEHNHIHDLYYTGISSGWVWGYGETSSRENRIGYNLIHDIGKEVLCDMGGIYTLGVQPGTRIYNNLVFNVKCRFYGGWGIYTDEGSGHMVIENNICHDCSRECFHQHYGRENIVRHNIAAFGEKNGIAITSGYNRQTGYASPGFNYTSNYNFYKNVVLVDGVPSFRSCMEYAMSPEQFFSDLNVFWDLSKKKHPFASLTEKNEIDSFEKWQEFGHDRHSISADPGFADPEKRDFHLKKGSILKEMNFPDPADTIENAGVRGGKKKK